MCDAVIRISPDNLDERIEKAVHTIVSCWDDWDGAAQQDEQREQNPQAWYDTIEAQLRCVLLGMVIDDDPQSVPCSRVCRITPKDHPAATGGPTIPMDPIAARVHSLLCRPCRRSEKCQP